MKESLIVNSNLGDIILCPQMLVIFDFRSRVFLTLFHLIANKGVIVISLHSVMIEQGWTIILTEY